MIENAGEDSRFRDHPGLSLYGIQSYVAVPLFAPGGEVFGTLCALDPEPFEIDEATLETLKLMARLVTYQLEEEERQRARQRFLGILAHDLRSPLQAISLSAQVLDAQDLPEASRRSVQQILRSSTQMSTMIQEIFDAVNEQSRGPLDEPRALDLDAVVQDAVREQRVLHPEVDFRLGELSAVSVHGNSHLLHRMLGNLLSNAVKYGDREREITVTMDEAESEVAVVVHNWGEPIPPPLLPNLFQPFQRGEDEPDRDGLGLGLFIAAEAARTHGGRIDVESHAEAGTRFRVTLPKLQVGCKVLDFSGKT